MAYHGLNFLSELPALGLCKKSGLTKKKKKIWDLDIQNDRTEVSHLFFPVIVSAPWADLRYFFNILYALFVNKSNWHYGQEFLSLPLGDYFSETSKKFQNSYQQLKLLENL